jgi:hypothetical protein
MIIETCLNPVNEARFAAANPLPSREELAGAGIAIFTACLLNSGER